MKAQLSRLKSFFFSKTDTSTDRFMDSESESNEYSDNPSQRTEVLEVNSRSSESKKMTVQAGFFESIELMRSISTNLENQAESQKKLLEAVPEALNSIRHNMTLSEIQDKKMVETLTNLNRTLIEMHHFEIKSQNNFKELFMQSDKKFNLVLFLLVTLAFAMIVSQLYF